MWIFHSYVSHNQRVILGVFMDPMWIPESHPNTRLGQHDADLLCVEEHHSPHLQPHLLFPRALLQREDHLAEISGNGLPLRDEIQGRHSNPGRTPGWICWCRWCFDDGDLWWRFDDDFMVIFYMLLWWCSIWLCVFDGDFLWWCLVMKLMKHVVWCRHLWSWVDDCFWG